MQRLTPSLGSTMLLQPGIDLDTLKARLLGLRGTLVSPNGTLVPPLDGKVMSRLDVKSMPQSGVKSMSSLDVKLTSLDVESVKFENSSILSEMITNLRVNEWPGETAGLFGFDCKDALAKMLQVAKNQEVKDLGNDGEVIKIIKAVIANRVDQKQIKTEKEGVIEIAFLFKLLLSIINMQVTPKILSKIHEELAVHRELLCRAVDCMQKLTDEKRKLLANDKKVSQATLAPSTMRLPIDAGELMQVDRGLQEIESEINQLVDKIHGLITLANPIILRRIQAIPSIFAARVELARPVEHCLSKSVNDFLNAKFERRRLSDGLIKIDEIRLYLLGFSQEDVGQEGVDVMHLFQCIPDTFNRIMLKAADEAKLAIFKDFLCCLDHIANDIMSKKSIRELDFVLRNIDEQMTNKTVSKQDKRIGVGLGRKRLPVFDLLIASNWAETDVGGPSLLAIFDRITVSEGGRESKSFASLPVAASASASSIVIVSAPSPTAASASASSVVTVLVPSPTAASASASSVVIVSAPSPTAASASASSVVTVSVPSPSPAAVSANALAVGESLGVGVLRYEIAPLSVMPAEPAADDPDVKYVENIRQRMIAAVKGPQSAASALSDLKITELEAILIDKAVQDFLNIKNSVTDDGDQDEINRIGKNTHELIVEAQQTRDSFLEKPIVLYKPGTLQIMQSLVVCAKEEVKKEKANSFSATNDTKHVDTCDGNYTYSAITESGELIGSVDAFLKYSKQSYLNKLKSQRSVNELKIESKKYSILDGLVCRALGVLGSYEPKKGSECSVTKLVMIQCLSVRLNEIFMRAPSESPLDPEKLTTELLAVLKGILSRSNSLMRSRNLFGYFKESVKSGAYFSSLEAAVRFAESADPKFKTVTPLLPGQVLESRLIALLEVALKQLFAPVTAASAAVAFSPLVVKK